MLQVQVHAFMSSEHVYLGDEGFALAVEALVDDVNDVLALSKNGLIVLPSGVEISIGQIMALAGDIYADPNEPISYASDAVAKCDEIVNDFVHNHNRDELVELLDLMNRERKILFGLIKSGQSVMNFPGIAGISFDVDYARITSYSPNVRAAPRLSTQDQSWWRNLLGYWDLLARDSRYMQVSKTNFDHFDQSDTSFRAFSRCQESALKYAWQAGQVTSTRESRQLMNSAIIRSAWSAHFMTDQFASGHFKTPRHLISTHCSGQGISGLLSKCQHDEMNVLGVGVKSSLGIEFTACGDNMLFDPSCAKNMEMAIHAVRDTFLDVFDTFGKSKAVKASASEYKTLKSPSKTIYWNSESDIYVTSFPHQVPNMIDDSTYSMFSGLIEDGEVILGVRDPIEDRESSTFVPVTNCFNTFKSCMDYVCRCSSREE